MTAARVAVVAWLAVGAVVIASKLRRVATRRELREALGLLATVLVAWVVWPAAIIGPRIDRWWVKRKRARR